jgi:adenylate kinase family enzyme
VTHCAEEDVGTPTSPIVVFLNGPPLSGKTSISNFTTNYPGLQWVVLQADKLLREQKLKESSQPSKRTMTISHSHLVVWLLLAAIREHCGKDKPQCHFLVEGFPSTAKQWAIWEEATGPVKDSTKKTGAEGLFIRNPLQLYLSTPTVALEARALALLERGTIHVRERPTLLGPLKKRQLAYTNAHSVIKNLPNTRLIKTAHKTIEDVFEVVFGELVALQSAPPILAARAGQSALILCVIGSPCAGKTTQAALLARRFGCKQLRATLADGVHMPAGSDPALLAAWSVVMEAVDCVKAGAVPRADGVQSKRDSGGYWETGSGQVGKPADGNSMGESQEGKVESQIFVIDGSPGTFEELWAFQAATHGCALQEQQRGTPMGERVKINWLNVVLALPKAEARLRVEGVHGTSTLPF